MRAPRFDAGDAVEPREEVQVLAGVEPPVEAAFVGHDVAHVCSHGSLVANCIVVEHMNRTAVRQEQRRDHLHQGRLPDAVGPQKRDKVAFVDSQVDAVEYGVFHGRLP